MAKKEFPFKVFDNGSRVVYTAFGFEIVFWLDAKGRLCESKSRSEAQVYDPSECEPPRELLNKIRKRAAAELRRKPSKPGGKSKQKEQKESQLSFFT